MGVGRHASVAEYEKLWEIYEDPKENEDGEKCIMSIALAKDVKLIERSFKLIEDDKIRNQVI